MGTKVKAKDVEAAAGNVEPHCLTTVQVEPRGNIKHELRGQNRPQAQVGKTAFGQLGMNTFRALIQGKSPVLWVVGLRVVP